MTKNRINEDIKIVEILNELRLILKFTGLLSPVKTIPAQ